MEEQPKKTAVKKSAAKKSAAKKSAAKKAPAKNSAAKKAPAKKTAAKKAPAKKTAAKKTAAKKTAAKNAPAKKTASKKRSGGRARSAKRPEDATKSPFWSRSKSRADEYLEGERDLRDLVEAANKKSGKAMRGKIGEIVDEVRALTRLVAAYARGEYRDIPKTDLALIVAGLAYFVSPVDFVPDLLPGGFLDDAAVLAFVITLVRDHVDAFLAWEEDGGPTDG